MSIINSIHFVLQHGIRRRQTTHYTDDDAINIIEMPVIVTAFPVPWRHPIYWWKMRHLRADTLLLEEEVNPEFSRRMRELEDEAFLRGTAEL